MPKLLVPIILCALLMPAHAQEAITTVTVVARRQPVVKQVDKTIYDVSTMARAQNGTAQDVLQATPDIAVTADGQISVRGNSRVTVLVNGKPTAMLSSEERAVALQTMSGSDIASVEVITNPSAAYHAGGGAIVNVVLKRQRKPGARAQLRGSASDQGRWHAGIAGDLAHKNISANGSLALRRDGTLKLRHSALDWNNPHDGQSGHTQQSSEVFVRRRVASAALGVDVFLGARDSLSLSARYDQRGSRPLQDTRNLVRSGAVETIFNRLSAGPNQQSDRSASLGYHRQGSGTALKATLQHSNTVSLIDKSHADVFIDHMRPTDYGHGVTRSARRLDQTSIDWSRALPSGQWGLGVDIQDEVNHLANYQAWVDGWTGVETPDRLTTNEYAVMTRLSALYITDRIRHGAWEVLLGGRIEHMAQQVGAPQGVLHQRQWRAFTPSLHLTGALSATTDLSLSYRRTLQRPDPRDLNPYTSYIDAHNLNRGNPALSPQGVSAWEIGADAKSAHVSGGVHVFYRISRDTVAEARSFTPENVLVTSKQNGGHGRSAGITGSLDWRPDPTLRLGIDGGVVRIMLETPELHAAIRQEGNVGYLNLRAARSAGDDAWSLDAHVQSGAIMALGRHGSTSSVNLSWTRQLSRTLGLTVNANDVFDGSKRSYRTDTSTVHHAGFDHFVARRLYVGFVQKLQ